MPNQPSASPRIPFGVRGLDDILEGGLPGQRVYLVSGDPGTGKTTLAMQFLLEGARRGEAGLYVTLSETSDELHGSAASHGWSLDKLTVYELSSMEQASGLPAAQTLFHPSEVELNETTKGVLDVVERLQPLRVIFDSLSEMRLLARDPLRYRRQILALKQFFSGRGCTVLLLDDGSGTQADLQLESLAHGVIDLEHLSPLYGAERRRLRVKKMRGMGFRGGYHDFRIKTGGIEAYPRLVASEHHETFSTAPISSGVPEVDALLGGGIDRGTSTLLTGPAGTGKTTLALQFALAAAAAGKRTVVYLFEEGLQTFRTRAAGLHMPLEDRLKDGTISLRQVDPAELSPGELAHELRREVEQKGKLDLFVLDTLNGFLNSMPEERFLTLHLHEILSFLGQMGVTSILIEAQHGMVSNQALHQLDVSYLADTVLLLRHFEARGSVRQAVSVVKKRTGKHERTIRELRLEQGGVRLGPPLSGFQGVLTGVPTHVGPADPLMEDPDAGHPRR
jgi:circadian clock protein KaiC